jgi:hypothetical protein
MKMKRFCLALSLLFAAVPTFARDKQEDRSAEDQLIIQFCINQADGSPARFKECRRDNVAGMVGLQVIYSNSGQADKDAISRCVEMNYVKQGMVNWEQAWICAKNR